MFKTLVSFYTSDTWSRFRKSLMLERVNINSGLLLCEHCNKPILYNYDCIGHHTIALTMENVNDHNISLNPALVQLVHHRCHNDIHERWHGWEQYIQRVYLVWGAPCAGKSSYVCEAALHDDLIVDIDSVWQCLSVSERYYKPGRLRRCAFGVYECLLDMVRTRQGKWRNAWIIGTYPLFMDRERMKQRYDCEMIHIDTPKEECILRCTDRPSEWVGYIDEYFDKLQY